MKARAGQACLALLAVLALLAACTEGSSTVASPGSGSVSSAVPSTPSATSGAPAISVLPASCDGVASPPTSTALTFIAAGRVWAVSPEDPSDLHCLFAQSDTSVFSWGPRGDRVVLAGLAVRGVGSSVFRPPGGYKPAYYTWSRPTGTTLWFNQQDRGQVFRADVGVAGVRDVTPVPGETYGDMAYHPSGLSVGFVTTDAAGTKLWMSTNQGTDAKLLVQAPMGTTFGHIVFTHDGLGLYYSVDKADGSHSLARYNLTDGSVTPGVWTGSAPISADIIELAGVPGVAITVGSSCSTERAVLASAGGSGSVDLSAGIPGPSSIVGRMDADRFIVASGGCQGPEDLYLVQRGSGAPQLLVRSVDTASMRQPEPTPAPALPPDLPASKFG